MLRHYWGVWSHNQIPNKFCVTLAYKTVPYSELGLFRTWGIFKSLPNMYDNSETWHSQNSLFKQFQWYLGIFRDIDAYSITLIREQVGERDEASPTLFENQKRCPDIAKKDPDCIHFGVKFRIQNVVLRIFKRKIPRYFPPGPLCLALLTKCLYNSPI